MRKKFVITLWVILFLCISAVSLAFYAIWHGWIGYMPNLYQLENPVNKYASQAVSADGKLLGTWSYSPGQPSFRGLRRPFPLVGQGIGGYGGRAVL